MVLLMMLVLVVLPNRRRASEGIVACSLACVHAFAHLLSCLWPPSCELLTSSPGSVAVASALFGHNDLLVLRRQPNETSPEPRRLRNRLDPLGHLGAQQLAGELAPSLRCWQRNGSNRDDGTHLAHLPSLRKHNQTGLSGTRRGTRRADYATSIR